MNLAGDFHRLRGWISTLYLSYGRPLQYLRSSFIYMSFSLTSCFMFLALCLYISSTEVGTKFFLLCCNQVSDHSRRAPKSILEKVLWAGLGGQFQQDCAESWPVLCVRTSRTSPQPCEQQLPVGPPC